MKEGPPHKFRDATNMLVPENTEASTSYNLIIGGELNAKLGYDCRPNSKKLSGKDLNAKCAPPLVRKRAGGPKAPARRTLALLRCKDVQALLEDDALAPGVLKFFSYAGYPRVVSPIDGIETLVLQRSDGTRAWAAAITSAIKAGLTPLLLADQVGGSEAPSYLASMAKYADRVRSLVEIVRPSQPNIAASALRYKKDIKNWIDLADINSGQRGGKDAAKGMAPIILLFVRRSGVAPLVDVSLVPFHAMKYVKFKNDRLKTCDLVSGETTVIRHQTPLLPSVRAPNNMLRAPETCVVSDSLTFTKPSKTVRVSGFLYVNKKKVTAKPFVAHAFETACPGAERDKDGWPLLWERLPISPKTGAAVLGAQKSLRQQFDAELLRPYLWLQRRIVLPPLAPYREDSRVPKPLDECALVAEGKILPRADTKLIRLYNGPGIDVALGSVRRSQTLSQQSIPLLPSEQYELSQRSSSKDRLLKLATDNRKSAESAAVNPGEQLYSGIGNGNGKGQPGNRHSS